MGVSGNSVGSKLPRYHNRIYTSTLTIESELAITPQTKTSFTIRTSPGHDGRHLLYDVSANMENPKARSMFGPTQAVWSKADCFPLISRPKTFRDACAFLFTTLGNGKGSLPG